MANILMIKPASNPGIRPVASPPLGLMYLAAYARIRRPGRDAFTIIDERIDPKSDAEWVKYVSELRPDIIALSAMTPESRRLKALSSVLKKNLPGIPLVAGGPHISSWGAKLVNTLDVDYFIKGEGEAPFVNLLDAIERNDYSPGGEISGLIYRNKNGSPVDNPVKIELPDINDLPFPSWDLVDLDKYAAVDRMTPIKSAGRYAPLFTSRGCPYGCIYCHNIFGKKFRTMSPERTVDQIEYLAAEHDVHDFEIFDDIFNLDRDRALAICDEIRKRGLTTRFSFPNGIRGDIIDGKMIMELRSIGTYYMVFAVESANERVQKLIHKNIDLRKIRENISIAAETKILTAGFFMIGFPSETRKEIWNTLKFAIFSKLHLAGIFTVIPQAGTKIAEMCGIHPDADDDLATDYQFSKNTISGVSYIELSLTHMIGYFLFYFYPPRLIRLLKDWPVNYGILVHDFKDFLIYLLYKKPKYTLSLIIKNLWKRS